MRHITDTSNKHLCLYIVIVRLTEIISVLGAEKIREGTYKCHKYMLEKNNSTNKLKQLCIDLKI